jgi:hypothetical protein
MQKCSCNQLLFQQQYNNTQLCQYTQLEVMANNYDASSMPCDSKMSKNLYEKAGHFT